MNTALFLSYILLFCITFTAALWDHFTGRIPNPLTLGGSLAGLCMPYPVGEFANRICAQTFWQRLGGWLIPFLILLPFFFKRIIGAGDIKLFSMVGTFIGAGYILELILLSMAFALAGWLICRLLTKQNRRQIHLGPYVFLAVIIIGFGSIPGRFFGTFF